MHLNCVSTLTALPFSPRRCERPPMPASSAAWQGLHTDELERDWIYDTGAAMCFIGWDHLTENEKSRTFQVALLNLTAAGGKVTTTTTVVGSVPFIGKRQCVV